MISVVKKRTGTEKKKKNSGDQGNFKVKKLIQDEVRAVFLDLLKQKIIYSYTGVYEHK